MPVPDFQPTLIGPTITIRPIAESDWPELFAAASDPRIWELHPAADRYTEPEFRKFFDGAVASKMGFAFVDRATGRLIGSSRYYGYEPEIGEIEIGCGSGLFETILEPRGQTLAFKPAGFLGVHFSRRRRDLPYQDFGQ